MSSPRKSFKVIDRHVGNKPSCSSAAQSPDMKAMCALMGQLDALKQEAQAKQKTSPKQNISLKKCRKRPQKHVKENDVRKNGNIRDWLVAKAKKPDGVADKKKYRSSHRQKVDVKKIKSPEKDDLVSYYVKYGVKVPTYESIMKQCKETEEYRKTLEENQLQPITEFPEYKTDPKKPKRQQEKLHCKHLTLTEVREALVRHLSYAAQIQSEEIYCERHAAFCRQQRGANFDEFVDLVSCDTSTEAFTDEHIQEMLRMLARKFGDKAQYYLVVLLPEVCLKIFMEVHNMGEKEAVKYLEERRYSDDSDLD